MFGLRHWWAVAQVDGGVYPDAIGMRRGRAIARFMAVYGASYPGGWRQAKRHGFRLMRVKVEVVP